MLGFVGGGQMGITDEIERLQKLKADGALTDDEFAQAKAALLSNGGTSSAPDIPAPSAQVTASAPKNDLLSPKANARAAVRILVLLAVVGLGGWFFLRMTVGEDAADRVAATLVKAPIDLVDKVENISASSWTGIPINVPYAGELTVTVDVIRGNDEMVHLIEANQVEAYKARKKYMHMPAFEAQKTKTYKRSGRVAAGGYYLVIEDKTLGILSASTSDVKVKVRIAP